jgi:PAS domain S-box-containing protein
LIENQTLLQQAQQVADLGYYVLDLQTGLWTSSEIMDGIFGINKEYIRSIEGWAGLVHPDERENMVAYFRNEVLGKKENFNREYKIVRMNDQAMRWVHGMGELQLDVQGNVVRMIGTIQDITERKRGEELLRLSESRFRTLFEEMMDGFALHEIICDDRGTPVDYRFLAVNPAFEKLTGLRAADIINKTVLEVMPQTEKVWIERYGRVALTGEPDHFEDYAAPLNTYYEVRAFSPAQNQFAVAFHDISQRKYSENITMARVKIVELATTHSLDDLLQTILDEAETLTDSCIGFYHFMEADQKTLSLQNWSTRTTREFCHADGKGMHYPVDKAGVWVDCVHTKKPVIHNNYGALTHRKGLPPGHAEILRELVVPVMRGDKIVAILGVGNKRSDYTQRDIDIVQQLAELAIEIVERKRSEEEVVKKNADLAALFSISAQLRTATSANEMLPVVLREVKQALNADASAVILLEPGEDDFLFALADGVLSSNTGNRCSMENSISGMVMQNRKPYATADFANDTNRCSTITNFEGLGAAVLVPLQSETEFIGGLLCARHKNALKGEFSAGEIQLLASIGEMVGTALRRARLYDDALLRLRRVQGLHTIDVAMTSNMDLNVTLYILLNQSLSLMEMDAVDILTFNPVTRTLNYTVGRGFRTNYMEHVQLRLAEGIAGRAALERKAIAVTDITSETNLSRADMFKKEGFQSLFVAPMVTKGQMRGVLELYSRRKFNPNAEWMEFLEALASQTAIAMDAAQLYNELQRSNLELSMAYDATIEGWSHALDLKDKETEGHTLRVTDWTVRLATLAGIDETEIVHLRRGALLHDIGKLGIPDQILGKAGKLTEEEWEIMRRHTVYGYNMLYPIEFLRPAIDIPYYHHEKWDGTGYPQGLAGEQIPYAARLFAIVDVWDAITSDRPYRKAWSFETALEYIKSESGKQFDPAIADLFLKLVDELITTPRYRL